jgi:hypothetical protein
MEEFISSKIKKDALILCHSQTLKGDLDGLELKIDFIPSDQYKYDIIIFDDIIIDSYKNYLKEGGKMILIIDVMTNYNYHPYNCLSNITFGYLKKYEYLEDVYDKLRENDLRIIDSYRLDTYDIIGLAVVKFGIICVSRF